MEALRTRLAALSTKLAFVLVGVVLLGIRFAAPSVSVYLAMRGLNTEGLDEGLAWYDGLLPLLLVPLILAAFAGLSPERGIDRLTLATVLGGFAAVVQWAGFANPGVRLVSGPWASPLLGVTVAMAVFLWTLALDRRLKTGAASARARAEFRLLGIGFAAAYGLHSLKFVDYTSALGENLPSGLLWLFDFGPVLLLCVLAIRMWGILLLRGSLERRSVLPFFGAPLALTSLGVLASAGLGGYILSNVLAWGGSYAIFAPSWLSLAIVGFALGGFSVVAWILRGSLPRDRWWPLVMGVASCGLAGLSGFGGSLASLAGLAFGLALASKGLGGLPHLRRE